VRERTLSALLIIPVVVVAIAAGGVGIGILVLALAALAGREAERLLPAAGRPIVRNGVTGGALVLVPWTSRPAWARSTASPWSASSPSRWR
jgi:CDP-diglyceride synthetase